MKPRILRDALKPIVEKLTSNEPSPIEKNSYKIARRSLWVSIASMIIAIIFGAIGIYFIRVQIADSPEKTQVQRILEKADEIITKDSILLSVQIDATNLNIEMTNFQKIEMLKKKFNRYNQITLLFTELEQYTFLYKLQKENKAIVKTQSVDQRLRIIKAITDILSNMEDIDDLIPLHNIGIDYGNCGTELMRYKMLYTDNRQLGAQLDTSSLGQNAFNRLMNRVIDFEEKVMPLMAHGRSRIERDIKQMNSVIILNDKIRDSIVNSRNKRHS